MTDTASARAVMDRLHSFGAKDVVISSSTLGDENVLIAMGSSVNSE